MIEITKEVMKGIFAEWNQRFILQGQKFDLVEEIS